MEDVPLNVTEAAQHHEDKVKRSSWQYVQLCGIVWHCYKPKYVKYGWYVCRFSCLWCIVMLPPDWYLELYLYISISQLIISVNLEAVILAVVKLVYIYAMRLFQQTTQNVVAVCTSLLWTCTSTFVWVCFGLVYEWPLCVQYTLLLSIVPNRLV